MSVRLYGAEYSVYVRICRMVLMAKGVAHELVPVDVFADGGPGAAHLERHPFGKIPAFEHGDLSLYETDAIISYIDEAFDGPALCFDTPGQNARMRQLMRIADNYAYPVLVWQCYVPLREDNAVVSDETWARADKVLGAIEALADESWLVGSHLSLADCYLWPILDYFGRLDRGRAMIDDRTRLNRWFEKMAQETVSIDTRYEAETG